MTLTGEFAGAFASVALQNVTREYPRHVIHLLTVPAGDLTQRALHPSFYGSYDWHSAVHMHWLLVRLLRTHPQLPRAGEIANRLDAHLLPAALQDELAYFESPAGRTFERPYGWAWLLELQSELLRLGTRRWIDAVAPLARHLAKRFAEFVSAAPYPIRAGSHGNTAFACVLALDFAHSAQDDSLEQAIRNAARRWYAADRNAPLAYEPSLDDFLSPALIEAVLMREVLGQDEFDAWLQGFLPPDLGPLATPPVVADRTDPKQSHLDGLSLTRAWCFRRLGGRYLALAERHLQAALPQVAGGDYVGEHWLASFAALALGEHP
jgi:DUF2891 family protein